IELAFDLGSDLNAPQVAQPRAFKTHLPWTEVPKGSRYVYALRDPKDVLVSVYHFHEGWRFEPGTIPFGSFARVFFLSRESWREEIEARFGLPSYQAMREQLARENETGIEVGFNISESFEER